MDNAQFKQAENLKKEIDYLKTHIAETEQLTLNNHNRREHVTLKMERATTTDYPIKLKSEFYNGLEFYELYMMRARKKLAELEGEFASL